jgi:hypothetical protein
MQPTVTAYFTLRDASDRYIDIFALAKETHR